ncbi:MAG TPA: 4-hydroxy-tetrahydrodipicolinate reductase [Chthoniobacterales bacterium]|jgi:4-hydroxy-tetrahydrodipicolinate reductase
MASKSPVRVLLIGSLGRMGQAIANLAGSDPDLEIVARCDRDNSIEAGMKMCEVAIDFSATDATEEVCRLARQNQKRLVIGTTGHTAAQKDLIENAAKSVPIVLASNFSVGVNALFWLSRRAARLLGEKFRVEIVETHHKTKKDAPSGTAKSLAEILQAEKPGTEIPVHSFREGEVVGEHTVVFAGPGEQLELKHKAESRETFASGALAAAKWVMNQPPGLYSMQDVLGL